MTERELIAGLREQDTFTIMLAELIGERGLSEPLESEATWETIGLDALDVLETYRYETD